MFLVGSLPSFAGSLKNCPFASLQHANELDASKLVTVYLQPDLGPAGKDRTLRGLSQLGFIPLNDYLQQNVLIGLSSPSNARAASRLDGIIKVTQSHDYRLTVWRQGFERTQNPPVSEDWDPAERWANMERPAVGTHYRTLAEMRRVARQEGVVIVMDRSRPDSAQQTAYEEFLFGGKTFYADDLPKFPSIVQLPGLVLHMNPMHKALAVRGTLNPLLGYGNTHGTLDKVEEMKIFRTYAPDWVADSVTASDFIGARPKLESLRQIAVKYVNQSLTGETSPNYEKYAKRSVSRFLSELKNAVNGHFAAGFYLKSSQGYATMESELRVTSDNFQSKKLTDFYFNQLNEVEISLSSSRGTTVNGSRLLDQFIDSANARDQIVAGLLAGGESVLIQEMLPVGKSQNGNNLEFRVDVFQGRVVNSSFRYGEEAYPDEAKQAALFIRNFLPRFPDRIRFMSAGFDVVQLLDGTFRVIEANAGTMSSFALPDAYAVNANIAISRFLGRPTPLIQALDKIFAQGTTAQAAYLLRVYGEQPTDDECAGLGSSEVLVYFRDKLIEEARQQAKQVGIARTMNPAIALQQILKESRLESEEDFAYTVRTADEYWERERKKKRVARNPFLSAS